MSKFESSPVTKEFQNQKQTHLPDPTIRIVAGVSGGPDSMAMLYLLHRFDVDTVVVHCNYQLRGESSDQDQELVENICMHWNIECVSLRFDAKDESKGNFQDWARKRRYRAFRDIKKEYDASLIMTAHHRDDQVETILQKIMRGAGISSWKGMDTVEEDLFRPFLNISKSDIMQFVQDCNVPYRIDASNEESTYARNFIRKHWFPDLNRLFPGWKSNLLRVQHRAEEFGIMSEMVLEQVSIDDQTLDRLNFLDLHENIWPPIILRFIKNNELDLEMSYGFLDDLEKLRDLQSGKKLQLSDHYFILRDRDTFKLIMEPGEQPVDFRIQEEQLNDSFKLAGFTFSKEPAPSTYSKDVLHLDTGQLAFPLRLRTWRSGDRFQPFGLDGTQLVSDHLTNRKVLSSTRNNALVLESFDETICAVIFPTYSGLHEIGTLSENMRCTSQSRETLTIRRT